MTHELTSLPAETYDDMYESGIYADLYKAIPPHVAAMNQYYVDLVIAAYGLHPKNGPILELGSGRGHFLTAWEARGFSTTGREISAVAIDDSGRANIHHGDASQLQWYVDDAFQIVFSCDFLEHLTDKQIERILAEQLRVAPYAAHIVAHEAGGDPTHINIKPEHEWVDLFRRNTPPPFNSLVFPNPYIPPRPLFCQFRRLPIHVEHMISVYHGGRI